MMRFSRLKKYSRLRKIALGGNIRESDVEFIYSNTNSDQTILMTLINGEKAKHDLNENWEGQFFHSEKESKNVIGFISYNVQATKNKVEIYVSYLETRTEYRKTRVVGYLLNEFKERVLVESINEVGKENVYISANVVNDDLSGFLERTADKLGINFIIEQQENNNNSNNNNDGDNYSLNSDRDFRLLESLMYSNFDVIDDALFLARNGNINRYKQIIYSTWGTNVLKIYGRFDNDNIDFTIYDRPDITQQQNSFVYTLENEVVELNCELPEFLHYIENNIEMLKSRVENVFPQSVQFKFLNNNRQFSIIDIFTTK